MAVDKGLYSAPMGIEEESLEQEENLEIEIVNPEMVTLDDGSVEVTIIPDADVGDIIDFGDIIADALDDSDLVALAEDLVGLVDADIGSRKDWADSFVK